MPKFGIVALLIILAIVLLMSDDIRRDWLGLSTDTSNFIGAW